MTFRSRARFSLNSFRRLIAIALIAIMVLATAPSTLAAKGVKDAAEGLMNTVESARLSALRVASEVKQRNAGPNGQNRGMPAAPVNPPPVAIQSSRSKAEREERAVQIKLNTSQDVLLQSRERISFSAIPLDYEGTPIHGLHAEWSSSNRQVIQVNKNGQAIAGKPGNAVLTVRAGAASQSVRVTVTAGDLDQFGGRKRNDTRKPKGATGQSSSQPKASASLSKSATRRQHSSGTSASVNAKFLKTAMPAMPQGSGDNPLIDEQTDSLYLASNSVGSPPGKTIRGAQVRAAATEGTENPGSENFSFGIPVFGLPGRGIDAALDLVHNSQLFNKSTEGGTTYMTYGVDSGWPAPGWRLGFGQIEYQGGPFTLTDADGTRHALACNTNNYPYECDTTDGTFIHYTGGSASGTLYYPNGTRVTYGAGGGGLRIYPTRITDPNGNFISISYVGTVGPKIFSIEDTLHRFVNFYYASNGDLVTIRAPGLNGGDRAVMRLYYDTVNITTSGLFQSSIYVAAPATARVIKYIYLPNSVETNDAHIGYSFDYTSYGMMYQATKFHGMTASWSSNTDAGQNPTGGTLAAVTTYNYEGAPGRSIPSGGLSETPDYNERKDDWAGRVSAQPVYQFSVNKASGVSIVTAPDGTVSETQSIVNPGQWDDGLVKDTYIDKQSSTVFLSHTNLDWELNSGNPRIHQITNTDDGGNSKATVFTYTSYNNISVVSERSFSGAELRRTEITYETSSNYINRHLLHLPTIVKVFPGGSQTAASHVVYTYDNYGSNHTYLTHRDDINDMHDDAFDPFQQTVEMNCRWECSEWEWPHTCINWEWVCDLYNPYDPATDYRGNVTSVTTYSDAAGASGAITHGTKYDIAGNVMSADVDCCQQKSFTYSGAGSSGNHDYAYPISVTRGSGGTTLTTSAEFDYSSGLLATTTDENNQVTHYYYNSASLRIATVQRPDNSTTSFYYGGGLTGTTGTSGTNGLHYFVNTATQLDATHYVDSYRFFDGRGAVTQTFDNYAYQSQLSASKWSMSDIEYNVMGRAYRTSNPYYSGGYGWLGINPDGFWTSSSFDHLGRVRQATMPRGDNNNSLTTHVDATYVGVITDVSDQTGKLRRQRVDEFGRVVRLDEPNSSNQLDVGGVPYQSTNYEYDTLNNLIHTSQTDSSSVTQHRYFKYDSLSRLIYEKQPEQGTAYTTSFGSGNNSWSRKNIYNSQGLLEDSFDAREIKTHITYDGLNRLSQVQYFLLNGTTPQGTPTMNYAYSQARNDPQGNPYRNVGRLTTIATDAGTGIPSTAQEYDYDLMGQVVAQRQKVGTTTYSLGYTYNLAGELLTETYPSGRRINYAYDEGARLSTVSRTVSGTTSTLSNAFQYEPHGGLRSETFGNTAVHAMSYNRRLQPSQVKFSLSSTVLQQYDYGYGTFNATDGSVDTSKNNGQIGSIKGTIGTSTQWVQGFIYDELGRLANTKEFQGGTVTPQTTPTYSQSYTYDRFGNRFQSANTGLGLPAILSTDIAAASNRFASTSIATYDNAGNITIDAKFRNLTYAYDANGRQTSASKSGLSQSSVYDSAGQRVRTISTTTGTLTRTMVYDIFGQDVADYTDTSGGTLERENIYRGGLLATYEEAGGGVLKYVLQDSQGSTRAVMTNNQGSSTIASRHDYLPFGEEIWAGTGSRTTWQFFATSPWANDNVRQRYGLTERDDTTGLDHTWFRKYEGLSGRWTSPDPYGGSMRTGDPQSFNRYSYVGNDPLNFVDPSGLDTCYTWDGKPYPCTHEQWEFSRDNPREVTLTNAWGKYSVEGYFGSGSELMRIVNDNDDVGRGGGAGGGGSAVGTNIINFALGACSTGASIGQYSNVNPAGTAWRGGVNGQWSRMGWGGNGSTGARSAAIGRASSFGLLSRSIGTLGAGFSFYQSSKAFRQRNYEEGAKGLWDAGFGIAGAYGGPWGAAASGAYFVVGMQIDACPGLKNACGRDCRRK